MFCCGLDFSRPSLNPSYIRVLNLQLDFGCSSDISVPGEFPELCGAPSAGGESGNLSAWMDTDTV